VLGVTVVTATKETGIHVIDSKSQERENANDEVTVVGVATATAAVVAVRLPRYASCFISV
jgi:hypothetical protein